MIPTHFSPLKSGQPLYSGHNDWSQCVLYEDVPLYIEPNSAYMFTTCERCWNLSVHTYICTSVLHPVMLQTMMEKLSLEVEKNMKLNSQLETAGDSRKVQQVWHGACSIITLGCM